MPRPMPPVSDLAQIRIALNCAQDNPPDFDYWPKWTGIPIEFLGWTMPEMAGMYAEVLANVH